MMPSPSSPRCCLGLAPLRPALRGATTPDLCLVATSLPEAPVEASDEASSSLLHAQTRGPCFQTNLETTLQTAQRSD